MWHFLFNLSYNMKLNLLILIIILNGNFIFPNEIKAQKTFKINGLIKESIDHKIIKNVEIQIENKNDTNNLKSINGKYSITLPPGNYTIRFKKLGFKENSFKVELYKDINQEILLDNNNEKICVIFR